MDHEVFKNPSDNEANQNRNSLSYDEVEHRLNSLIDSYKQSLKNVSKQEDKELPERLFQNYDTSLYNDDDVDTITMSLNPDYSTSLNNYISDHPDFPSRDIPPISSTSFHASVRSPTLTSTWDIPYKYPYLDAAYISDVNPRMTGYTDANIPPIINDQYVYGTNVTALPSQDPLNFQINETVTFKKLLNTGISSQLSKQISFLLYELNRLKETNAKLNKELTSCKSELNSEKNKIILMQGNSQFKPNSSDNNNLAGFVDEIYRAQKLRDVAMMDRLKEANQVKNFALALAQQRSSPEQNDIVSSLVRSQSVNDLRASTSKFLQAIADEKDRKRTANEEEMETILLEKDLIYKQKMDLEHEKKALVEKLKSESELKSDFQKRLFEVEKEKNQLFTDINFLQNKLKDLKTCENLYKSLSKEEELHQQFSNKLSQLTTELENKNKQTKMQKLELDRLRSSLDDVTRDNKLLSSKCNSLEVQVKEVQEQIERLNRLVDVLRRKLMEGSLSMRF